MKMRVIAVRSALASSVLAFGMMAYAGDTYHVTLLKPSVVGGQELKPGDYKVEVNNDTAIISHGKKSVETKIKTESVDKKFDSTTVRYEMQGDKYKVQAIGIGGTKTRLLIQDGTTAAGAL